jgi:uncharacterized protein
LLRSAPRFHIPVERVASAWRAVFVALLLFIAGPAAAAPTFPALTGRVVDDAGILSADTQQRVAGILAQQEKQTGDQIVVVTLKSLQDYQIEDYGYQLGRHWGIGQKGKNNGALIIVAPNEHKARIEVGYGLEGVLTDAQCSVIIDEIMRPAFKQGDYDAGVLNGTLAVLKVIGGAKIDASAQPVEVQDQRGQGVHIPIFLIVFLIWIVFGRFLWPLFFLGGIGRGFGGGFGGRGFGGGGFGGGGFSGGGGSFGGGGASGSW